jgi:hypothetical protein
MSQPDRNPIALIVTGVLLTFAIAAHLVGGADFNTQLRRPVLHDLEIPRSYYDRAITDSALLQHHHVIITKSLPRPERLTSRLEPAISELEALRFPSKETASLTPRCLSNQADR